MDCTRSMIGIPLQDGVGTRVRYRSDGSDGAASVREGERGPGVTRHDD